jgi:hypothetical protein
MAEALEAMGVNVGEEEWRCLSACWLHFLELILLSLAFETLTLMMMKLSQWPRLWHKALSYDPSSTDLLILLLSCLRSYFSFSLDRNEIGDEGAGLLANAVASNSTLVELVYDRSALSYFLIYPIFPVYQVTKLGMRGPLPSLEQ